jgi:hypothetical protein
MRSQEAEIKKHKPLTTLRAVLVYTLAMAMVIGLEFPRVSSWARETWWDLTSTESSPALEQHIETRHTAQIVPSAQTGESTEIPAPFSDFWSLIDPVANAMHDYGFGQSLSDPGPLVRPGASPLRAVVNKEKTNTSLSAGLIEPHKVLIVGDSEIAEGFGPALQRKLETRPSVKVLRKGVYSTGFVHQETFSWEQTLKGLIAKFQPDLIVIHLGANDPIDIVRQGHKRMYFGSDPWRETYASRVARFLKPVAEKKIMAFWVGLPIMGSSKYGEKIEVLNSLYKQECEKVSGCFYVDTWTALTGPKGKYTAYLRVDSGEQTRIRGKDQVHLTGAGGKMLTEFFLKIAAQRAKFPNADIIEVKNKIDPNKKR